MISDETAPVPWGWRDVGAVVLLLVVGSIALVTGLGTLVGLMGLEVGAGLATPVVYAATAGFFLLMLLGVYLFAARRAGWAALGLRPTPSLPLLATPALVVVGFFGVVLVNGAIAALRGEFENPQIDALTGGEPLTLPALLLALLLVAGLAPLVEELFFRGMIYPLLRQQWGPAVAVVASAAIFSAAHLIPLLFPALFVVGLLLGLLREWSRSLWPCIFYHALQNGLALLAINAVLSGAV